MCFTRVGISGFGTIARMPAEIAADSFCLVPMPVNLIIGMARSFRESIQALCFPLT